MQFNKLGQLLENMCYGFLAINFLWGFYCVVLLWRRIEQLRFRSEAEEGEFIEQLKPMIQKGDWGSAAAACEFDFRAVPRLLLILIANRNLEFSQLRLLITTRIQRDILSELEQKLGWVVAVIKGGPLLGLFGTVLGMMGAFGRIGTGEKVQPSQIAEEISIALICTAMGLATAIPLGYMLSTLTNRFRNLQEAMNSSVSRILDDFRAAGR